ncbi:SigE family RNA polymerase sigma factor [Dactylosporangium matsuzakiense]|uniref:RNA polymerase sigma24 factor n=1 Tax=Dactylosporangium matsuzakiense TaxID=53360 RepID=A0A9W6KNV7_9ACTN|nr:SigE family RNA polymerase sigma factor [Dactylosporangium matsuzakiense]UWZ40929.1 SigE family RNA polymerase sigma factor [Dactylosporangium matsuzakiense]GLL04868.1 RNA polymerase sigma24 factor [Dactylosporangium matsuzakiense]
MQRSDEVAYREYVTLRMDVLRRTAYLLCHDWHTADDLVATTLARLYDKWKRAGQADNIDAYVRAMLVNAYLDERRRPWRREVSTDRMPDVAAPGRGAAGEHGDLLALVRALPKKRRAVIVLRFYLDHSVEETAEMLGISTGTVKSQTARALETLRAAITNVSGVQS